MRDSNHQPTAAELIARLKDPELVVRVHAATVLGTMGEEAVEAVPALMDLLASEEVQDRRVAALALGGIGPDAAEAIDALVEAANDEDERLADLASWALEQVDLAEPEADAA